MPERPPRLPRRPRAALPPEAQTLYDRIVAGPRGRSSVPLRDEDGALLGPFAVMTLTPAVGDAVQELGAALRFGGTLDPFVREAAILLVAVHHRSAFEWRAHEGAAREAGLSDAQLAALRAGDVPTGTSPAAHAALQTVVALLARNQLDDAGYALAVRHLGQEGVAELVWLCGYYAMLATAITVFESGGGSGGDSRWTPATG